MGQRISFFRIDSNKEFKDLLFENFGAFRYWYGDTEQEGEQALKDYLLSNKDIKGDFDGLDKKLLDELSAEFVGNYCDATYEEKKILEPVGPMINKWRYQGSSEMVVQTNDQEFIALWDFIIVNGRSRKDFSIFDSFTNEYIVGFLTSDEHRLLKAKIEHYFGSIDQIREKYRTEQEKEEAESGKHNPRSSGLEYVLQVLNELDGYTNDLITGIE